jgi:hypothetical protein
MGISHLKQSAEVSAVLAYECRIRDPASSTTDTPFTSAIRSPICSPASDAGLPFLIATTAG